MSRYLPLYDRWGKLIHPPNKRPRQERHDISDHEGNELGPDFEFNNVVAVDDFAREKWVFALVDPLLSKPVYWKLDKPKITVSFTEGQLFSVIF
jgi:hypothetical protein